MLGHALGARLAHTHSNAQLLHTHLQYIRTPCLPMHVPLWRLYTVECAATGAPPKPCAEGHFSSSVDHQGGVGDLAPSVFEIGVVLNSGGARAMILLENQRLAALGGELHLEAVKELAQVL